MSSWPFLSVIDKHTEESVIDQHVISPYDITALSTIQIMRIKEMITKDNMSSFLNKFSQLVSLYISGEQ